MTHKQESWNDCDGCGKRIDDDVPYLSVDLAKIAVQYARSLPSPPSAMGFTFEGDVWPETPPEGYPEGQEYPPPSGDPQPYELREKPNDGALHFHNHGCAAKYHKDQDDKNPGELKAPPPPALDGVEWEEATPA